jgi:hypothetical protein
MNIIDKIAEYIGFDKTLRFIEELGEFYLRPLRFFNRFFLLQFKDKLIQTGFYAFLVLGLAYICIEDISIKELLRTLVIELSTLVITFGLLSVGEFVISRIQKNKPRYQSILFFVILVKLLIAPFQIIFFGLFLTKENYNFFFLANCAFVILIFYVLFFSARIFHLKKRYILLNIFINIIMFNLAVVVSEKFTLDSYSTLEHSAFTDEILTERLKKSEPLLEPYKVPTHHVLYKQNKHMVGSHFLFSTLFDSICKGDFGSSETYQKNIQKNLHILDTLIPNLQFQRNKEFYAISKRLHIAIDSVLNLNVVTYTEKDITKTTVYLEKDSSEMYTETIVSIPKILHDLNYKLYLNELEIENISTQAALPLDVMEYLTPVIYLLDTTKNVP